MRRFLPLRSSALLTTMALASGLLGAVGVAVAAAPATPAAAVTTLPGYTAMTPVRICDTRAAGAGVVANQCDTAGHTPLSTGGVRTVTVAGAAGVPADATAVVLHVTATGTNAASYLTVWPTGQAQPTAASLNWSAGQTVANLVETGVGTSGQVSVFNYAFAVDLVIDVQGYVKAATGGLFVPMTPTRVCDTRMGQPANQCNQGGTSSGKLGAGKTRVVNVVNGFGVPAGATAVVVNLTATTTSTASYLTVWPDGTAQPLASSLNWAAGQTVSNRALSAISPVGAIDVFNALGTTDVVIDLAGYFTATGTGSGFFPLPPTRICDTRPIGPGVASNFCNNTPPVAPIAPGSAIVLFGFNPTVTALVVNVTVTNTGAAGFMTIFPDDSAQIPLAADITWAAHQTVGNLTVANLGSTAAMALFNGSNGSTDVVLDVVGYYSTTAPPVSAVGSASARSLVMPSAAKRVAHGLR